jgi:hypothetical protein
MQDEAVSTHTEQLRALTAELARQDSEFARTCRTLTELADVTLRVSEADLRAIAEATATCPPAPSPAPSPWRGARC